MGHRVTLTKRRSQCPGVTLCDIKLFTSVDITCVSFQVVLDLPNKSFRLTEDFFCFRNNSEGNSFPSPFMMEYPWRWRGHLWELLLEIPFASCYSRKTIPEEVTLMLGLKNFAGKSLSKLLSSNFRNLQSHVTSEASKWLMSSCFFHVIYFSNLTK